VVLVGQDGVQRPPIHFPQGGHLLAFLSCLENGLLPRGQLDPPLWAHREKGNFVLSNTLTVSCFDKIQIGFSFLLLAQRGKKGSPYSITERRVPELIRVLGSQPAGDVSHKPGGRLPLLSARPAVTPATLNRAATSFAAW